MLQDYDEVPGCQMDPRPVKRELSQQQKAARAVNAYLRQKRARQWPHPYFAACVCEYCEARRL